MERTTRQFTISLPPDMAEQVVAAAKAESRTISELFREAFRTYRAQRIQTRRKPKAGAVSTRATLRTTLSASLTR